MKVYKKSALLLGMAMLSGTITAMYEGIKTGEAPKSKKDVLQGLKQAKKDFFSPGMGPTHPTGLILQKKWEQALYDLQTYAEANADGNLKILNAASLSVKVGNDLAAQIMGDPRASLADSFKLDKAIKILRDDPWWLGRKREVRNVLLKAAGLITLQMRDIYPAGLFEYDIPVK